jgi:hypothetical protein
LKGGPGFGELYARWYRAGVTQPALQILAALSSAKGRQYRRLYPRLLGVYTCRRKAGLLLSERPACNECERLGQQYAELVLSRTNLEERYLSAKLRHDHELAAMFVIKLNDAASAIARLRQAMRDHVKQAHPD